MPERRETAVAHRNLKRRRVLKACCGVALCAPVVARGDETDDAAAPPQTDDALVFAYGDRAGQVIAAVDVALGAKQLLAYPMHVSSRRVRDGTRHTSRTRTRGAIIFVSCARSMSQSGCG